MNKEELIALLKEIAETDLADGSVIHDHPCSVAVRAIEQCFDDIEYLIPAVPKMRGSKRLQMLAGLTYNPSW